ncbi:MAG TPA: S41 family peptidase, partial [Ferruginibacter sp.]|nr:S41 family peptidase [Ferruginibacter sp.]
RSNGGGRVGLSTMLTRYVSRKPFKVADSLYSVAKSMAPYTNHIKNGLLTNIELFFITKKYKDGYFHLGHLERKTFKPKTKNNFKGKVYILTNGPTFSASALFCNAMKGQPGVTLVGEETGGGWYGNNGIIIPDIVLPNTKIRVRLPLFRLLQFEHDKVPQKGTGVIPDIYCGPSLDALIHKVDNKMEAVIKMIRSENPQQ